MHLVVMRRDVYERHPFIASSLYDGDERRQGHRAREDARPGTLRYMLPCMTAELDVIDEVFGGDPWPYGIEPNRPTLGSAGALPRRAVADQSAHSGRRPVRASVWAIIQMTRWRTTVDRLLVLVIILAAWQIGSLMVGPYWLSSPWAVASRFVAQFAAAN